MVSSVFISCNTCPRLLTADLVRFLEIGLSLGLGGCTGIGIAIGLSLGLGGCTSTGIAIGTGT